MTQAQARRKTAIAVLISLLVGLVTGFLLGRYLLEMQWGMP